MTMMSNVRKAALAAVVATVATTANAQEQPGDDYENVCNTTYTTTYTYRYGGLSSCSAYSYNTGFVQLYEWVLPQYSNTRTLYGFAQGGGLLSCLAFVPYYDTLTTTTPTTTCSLQPRQPFVALSYYSDYCDESPDRVIGELYWSAQAGDTQQIQWRYSNQTQFNAHWAGSASYLEFDFLRSTPIVYRMRTTRNGATGSWSYVSPRCQRDRHER
jgi:hypothetical protein